MLGAGVGNVALVVATSAASSPTLAAAILAVAPWRWLFYINVPFGAVALALSLGSLPTTPRLDQKLDALSVALNAATFGLLIVGVDALGSRDVFRASLELAGAVAAGALLTWRQFGLALPVLPIDLLRRPVFALSMVSSVSSFAAQSLAFVALPFLFEGALHRSATATGLLMTPWPLATALMAPIFGASRGPFRARAAGIGGARHPRRRLRRDRDDACRSQRWGDRVAPCGLRIRVRLLSVAQQQSDHLQRAAGAQRRRERPAVHRAPGRAVLGRRDDGGHFRPRRYRADGDGARHRRRARRRRRFRQRVQANEILAAAFTLRQVPAC